MAEVSALGAQIKAMSTPKKAALAVGGAVVVYMLYQHFSGSSTAATTSADTTSSTTPSSGIETVYENSGAPPAKLSGVGADLARVQAAEKAGNKSAANSWTHRAWLSAGKPKGEAIFKTPYPKKKAKK